MSKKCDLFQYAAKDELEVYRIYGRTPETFAEDVETVREWSKKQPHFPEVPPDVLIKSFLRSSKCSVERVKQRLDMFYTIRNFAAEFFRHPLTPEVLEQTKYVQYVPLPKLTKDLYRVLTFHFTKECPENYNPTLVVNYTCALYELRFLEDISLGVIFIVDCSNVTLGHILRVSPTILKKLSALFENAYCDRQKACHIIYSGPGADTVVSIIKGALRAKLKERVFLHKNYQALYEYFPKEMLPRDYDGEEKTIAELTEMVKEKFKEHSKRYEQLARLKTNETLRPGKPVNDEFFGFYGNFKKLQVD